MGRAGRLERDRLVAAVRRAAGTALVVIEAPAGFGKTALVDATFGNRPPSAPEPSAPEPGATGSGAPGSTPGPVTPPVARITATPTDDAAELLARTAGHDPAGIVVVDDAHHVDPAALAALVEASPGANGTPGARLVLSGRAVAVAGLSRLVVHGDAVRIDADDLAFDDDEVARFVATLTADAPATFDADPAGWPPLTRWPAIAGGILTGDDRPVAAYLAEEVVPALGPDTARLVAAANLAGDTSDDALAAVAEALDLDPDAAPTVLAAAPLVHRFGRPAVLHPTWRDATAGALEPTERRAVHAAMARLDRRRGRWDQAGARAVGAGDADVLAEITRDALQTQPPRVSAGELEAWIGSGLLTGPTLRWARGTLDALGSPASTTALATLADARAGFEAAGDMASEVGVLFAIGMQARRVGDLATLASLFDRGRALAEAGDERIEVLAAMGRALLAQMQGDPAGALAELDTAPPRVLVGDWAAQLDMMRATNLLLVGRNAEAIVHYERATGSGSNWSRAVAHDLLGLARWLDGDRDGAHLDAATAVSLAPARQMPAMAAQLRAARDAMLALDGRPVRDAVASTSSGAPSGGETATLEGLPAVIGAIHQDDLDRARQLLAQLPEPPSRTMRSTSWTAALDVALGTDRAGRWRDVAETHASLRPAVLAGEAAARWLSDGEPPERVHRPYLPVCWWGEHRTSVTVQLTGATGVWRNGTPVDHPRWARERVRELCLHLALVPEANRADRAADLWPELTPDRAAANLRVTLSQLLDVLDPDRPRGEGSALVDQGQGRLAFARSSRLHVDLIDARDAARRLLGSIERGESALALASARRILELVDGGPLLAGSTVGDWVEGPRRRFEEVLLRALGAAGPVALSLGEHELADRIGSLALLLDPWAEASGRLVVQARLAGNDLDGARRALVALHERLDELDVPAQPATRELAAQLGMPRRR